MLSEELREDKLRFKYGTIITIILCIFVTIWVGFCKATNKDNNERDVKIAQASPCRNK